MISALVLVAGYSVVRLHSVPMKFMRVLNHSA